MTQEAREDYLARLRAAVELRKALHDGMKALVPAASIDRLWEASAEFFGTAKRSILRDAGLPHDHSVLGGEEQTLIDLLDAKQGPKNPLRLVRGKGIEPLTSRGPVSRPRVLCR